MKIQIGVAEERAVNADKRAEDAEAKAAKSALDLKESVNKCDALRRRLVKAEEKVQAGKEELCRSKAASESAEEKAAKLVLEVKQVHNKCEALRKRKTKSEEKREAVCEELRMSQAALEEMRKSGKISVYFLDANHIFF